MSVDERAHLIATLRRGLANDDEQWAAAGRITKAERERDAALSLLRDVRELINSAAPVTIVMAEHLQFAAQWEGRAVAIVARIDAALKEPERKPS